MKQIISLITIFLCISFAARADEEQRWSGGDISLLPEYEKAGAQYKDTAGAVALAAQSGHERHACKALCESRPIQG